MICVSIGRGRHKHLMAEHARMVEQGASLVELRLDYIVRAVNLKRILVERPGPVIVTCRRKKDGGKWEQSEDERVMLLRAAIAEQVEYVDLEEDIASGIPRYGSTKRIISFHDFEKTPEDLPALHARMAACDADVVKIATMANNPHDNVRMFDLLRTAKVPTVGMCMGDMGTPTRLLAGMFGAPFTYATFTQERAMAPGQMSYRQMVDVYNYDRINTETELYGVIADPIAHTLSPTIHNAAFQSQGLNKVYVPFRVPAEHLDQFIVDCKALGIRGLSVTIPHKEAMLAHCTKVDKAARGIGAVNTVIFEGNEVLGFNTDYRAAMNCLDRRLASDRKTPLAGHSALVLGAGGAARAVVFGLIRRGADVCVCSRTHGRALMLAEQMGCRAMNWENRHAIKAEVIINTTPIGMHPNVDESPFDKRKLRPNTIVFDTVYNPEQTLFLKEARQRQCRVISGLEMFVGQAAFQYQHFTGQEPPMELIGERMRRAIGAANY